MEAETYETANDRVIDFARVVAFTDGVFAIAVTLLVLGIDVPSGHPSELSQLLRDQRSNLFAYALSFAVIGRVWLTHHNFVGGLKRFDGPLIYATLFYLAFVSLLPFTSQLLGNYGSESQAVVIYAVNIVAINLSFAFQVVHAYRRGLLHSRFRRYARTNAIPVVLSISIVFAASIPLALVSPLLATLFWIATLFVPRRFIAIFANRALGPDSQ